MRNIPYQRNTFTKRKPLCGFTLIEMLVYVAIFVIVSLIVVGTFLSLKTVFGQARTNHTLVVAAETSLERMVFEIENAKNVELSGSIFNNPSGALALSNGTKTRVFYLDGAQLRIKENGLDAGPLTPPEVSVEELLFTHYQNPHTEGVRVSLTLHIDGRFSSTTRTFTTLTLLRNSYE